MLSVSAAQAAQPHTSSSADKNRLLYSSPVNSLLGFVRIWLIILGDSDEPVRSILGVKQRWVVVDIGEVDIDILCVCAPHCSVVYSLDCHMHLLICLIVKVSRHEHLPT